MHYCSPINQFISVQLSRSVLDFSRRTVL